MQDVFYSLEKSIIACKKCPRLVEYRKGKAIPSNRDPSSFWAKPLPGFGDPKAWLLILGLAPAAQGGNRTGRVFTGDLSARFLMASLYRCGFASQPFSEEKADGLQLKGCYLTAAVKCVPPKNLPQKQEFMNCSAYLGREIALLKQLKVVLALGKLAFQAYFRFFRGKGTFPPFLHGKEIKEEGGLKLYASYHPSPQNTHTGRLTEKMFDALIRKIQRENT